MDVRLRPLAQLLELNADLLLNCLHDLSESDASARQLPGANSIAFITAHVIDARHFMAQLLDRPIENPLQAALGAVKGIDEVTTLPSVGELSSMWVTVAGHVSHCLETTSGESLDRPSGHTFPVPDTTVLGALAFLVQHEAYHVGQVALLRKGLGYRAMSYERRPRRA